MLRRSFLALPALSLACGDDMAGTHEVPKFGLSPWHMWGTTQNGALNGVALVSSSNRPPQLARINYARPETWSFLLFVQLVSATADIPVAVNFDFIVITGLGRNSVTLDPFKRIVFPLAETTAANINATKPFRFATRIQSPILEAADAADSNIIEWIPGQDIQVAARVESTGSINAGNQLRFQVGAFLSPRTHLRPEWFAKRFRGGEQGGT
jgi:hypothetical protein